MSLLVNISDVGQRELPPIRRVSDGGDGEDVKISPPHPGDDGVLAQVVHRTVNVGVGPGVGEHRHVPRAPEGGARGQTGHLQLLPALVNVRIVISCQTL